MRAYLLVVLLAVSLPAVADDAGAKPVPTLTEIRADQARLAAQVRDGKGMFADMPEAERSRLANHQQRIAALIGDRTDVQGLSADDRVELFNLLEQVKSMVARAEDDRKVCERVRAVGSNRIKTVCSTVGERRREKEDAQNNLRAGQVCNKSYAACIGG